MKAPCKDCPDRTLSCHSSCAAYLLYQEDRVKSRQAKQSDRSYKDYSWDIGTKAIRKKKYKR